MKSFKTKITLQEFQEFNMAVYKKRWSYGVLKIVSILFIFLFFVMIYLSHTLNEKLDWTTFGVLIFALLYLFGIPWLLKNNAKRTYLANAVLQEEIIYQINDAEIITKANSYSTKLKWKEVYKVEENNSAILIYFNKQSANIIPKADLTADELAELKNLIRSKKGFPKKLKE